MPTVALNLINRFVAPEVIGCPTALIENKILTKAIEFCERSEAWRHDMSPINKVAFQPMYSLDIPPETQVVGIKTLFDNSQPIYPKSEQQIDSDWPQLNTSFGHNSNINNTNRPWRTLSEAEATFYYQVYPSTVNLVPMPSAAGDITGTLAVKPLPDGTLIDQTLYEQFFDHIAAGAKAELMAMPEKDWTNAAMVVFYNDRFEAGIDLARGKEARSHQTHNNTTMRVRAYS